ncbi:MAG: arginase family protein, partial [Desulfovibrio sp.]|nr:arginase family protein [Desulfovibrio sp.]
MSAENNKSTTLRLIMPEWQGGDYDLSASTGELYPLGALLLAFLAPKSSAETIIVPIEEYTPGTKRDKENGVVRQEAVIRQMKAAMNILEYKKPDRVVTFGGECLVSQAPFDYLNGRYNGNLGIIW